MFLWGLHFCTAISGPFAEYIKYFMVYGKRKPLKRLTKHLRDQVE